MAALGVTTRIPTKNDDRDDQTVRGIVLESDPVLVDTSIFDILSDFKLDLCLSAPSSPTASVSNLPPSTPSPPLSPTLSRSISFSSAKAATTSKKSMKKKPSKVSSTVPARSRGSWPLVKYTGRGTPIDRLRMLEWGGFSTEEVTEDGFLLSPCVRNSEDSTYPESAASSASHSHHAQSEGTPNKEPSIYEPPPELGPLEIESPSVRRSAEWDQIMKSVLARTAEGSPNVEESEVSQVSASENTDAIAEEKRQDSDTQIPPLNFFIMSKEQVEEFNSGLEAELGLNAALDLGFVRETGSSTKWTDLKLHQLPGLSSRASSPSVYSSQAVTLRKRSPAVSRASDRRSASSTKAEADTGEADPGPKSQNGPWWRRMFGRFRRVQTLFALPKTLF